MNLKNKMIETLVKMIICGILAGVILNIIKHVKLMNIYILKNISCEKHLIGKLVLKCEDEILNTTETLIIDEEVARAKSICLIHTISLVIVCLLLLVIICATCYFYYAKYHDTSIKLGRNMLFFRRHY